MKTVRLNPEDVIVAEDDLQQTYYLGKVDYWLIDLKPTTPSIKSSDGSLYNLYTDTPLIATGQELEALLKEKERGTIYVIGSGEKSAGSFEALQPHNLQQYNPQIFYKGRDGRTVVWYFSPP